MKMFTNYLRRNKEETPETITPEPVVIEQPTPKLSILGGGRTVTLDQLREVKLPTATHTYRPIGHDQLVDKVKESCRMHGLEITHENHKLNAKDNHYFGLFAIKSYYGDQRKRAEEQGVYNIIGLRNSHDKKFPAGVMAGDAPFVCSNLCFSNEIVFGRKHTVNFFRDIDALVDQAVRRTVIMLDKQGARNERYIKTSIDDVMAHDLIIKAYRNGACNLTDIGKIAEYWHEKSDGFVDRNLWSLKNAFTAMYRKDVFSNPKRAAALHHTMDDIAFVA